MMAKLRTRPFFHWLTNWAGDWPDAWVPAQLVFYLFAFTGTLNIIFTQNSGIGFDELNVGAWVPHVWRGLGIVAPLMVLASWWLISHSHGRARLAGIYLRAGGDLVQFIALFVFILVRLPSPPLANQDARIYGMWIISAMAVFVFLLLIRDCRTIVLVNELTGVINAQQEADEDAT